MENWKPIPGYEGIYDASDLGRIRSAPGKTTANSRYQSRVWKTRIMKPKYQVNARRHDGRVTLWKNGEEKDFLVARLIASAWHGQPAPGMTVNHINGDYLDNRAENLEWVSRAENIKHGFRTGLFASIQKGVVLSQSNGRELEFPSMSEASRFIGRNVRYISAILSKNIYIANGKDGTQYTVKLLE